MATVNGKTIDLTPTKGMKAEAEKYRAWKKEGRRGGTEVAARRASQILSGDELSAETVIVMAAWFARHEVDKQGKGFRPGEPGYPSPGRVAWAAWGGDSGQTWATARARSVKRARGEKVKAISKPNAKDVLAAMPDGEPLYQIARRVLTAFGKGIVNTWAPVLRTKEMEPFDEFTAAHTMGARFIPIITSYIDDGGRFAVAQLDQQEADQWLVSAPQVIDEAKAATLDLCKDTVASFRRGLTDHIDNIRKELGDSIYAGETSAQAVDRLAQWVKDEARWRARRIAVTESARAWNTGQVKATESYDFVAGYKLVLSSDACPLCHAIERICPVIPKGGKFGENGKNDKYSELKAPPFHPGCRCTLVVVFDDEVPKEWPKPAKPGENGYIQPSEDDYANAIEGGYESVAIGNAKNLTGFVTINDDEAEK